MSQIIFKNDASVPVEKPANEPIHWRVCVYGLCVQQGKLLMVKSTHTLDNHWELPGGGQELEESLQDALKREFMEEVGCEMDPIDQVPFATGEQYYYSIGHKKFFHAILLFYRVNVKGELSHTGSDEIKRIEWRSLDQIAESNCHPMIWEAVKQIKNAQS